MSDFQSIQLIIRRALAYLHAGFDSGADAIELQHRAEQLHRSARTLMRRAELASHEREELAQLLAGVERVRAALPHAIAA
jgi:hypothetical protein